MENNIFNNMLVYPSLLLRQDRSEFTKDEWLMLQMAQGEMSLNEKGALFAALSWHWRYVIEVLVSEQLLLNEMTALLFWASRGEIKVNKNGGWNLNRKTEAWDKITVETMKVVRLNQLKVALVDTVMYLLRLIQMRENEKSTTLHSESTKSEEPSELEVDIEFALQSLRNARSVLVPSAVSEAFVVAVTDNNFNPRNIGQDELNCAQSNEDAKNENDDEREQNTEEADETGKSDIDQDSDNRNVLNHMMEFVKDTLLITGNSNDRMTTSEIFDIYSDWNHNDEQSDLFKGPSQFGKGVFAFLRHSDKPWATKLVSNKTIHFGVKPRVD
jgi:hypothetical protein